MSDTPLKDNNTQMILLKLLLFIEGSIIYIYKEQFSGRKMCSLKGSKRKNYTAHFRGPLKKNPLGVWKRFTRNKLWVSASQGNKKKIIKDMHNSWDIWKAFLAFPKSGRQTQMSKSPMTILWIIFECKITRPNNKEKLCQWKLPNHIKCFIYPNFFENLRFGL